MKGFEDHVIRLSSDQLIYRLPAKSVYKWQARGIKSAASYNTCYDCFKATANYNGFVIFATG